MQVIKQLLVTYWMNLMNQSLTHLNFFFCLARKSFLANHPQRLLQWYYKKLILLDANTPFASLFLDSPSLRITSKNWEWLISISYKVSRGSRVSDCFLSPGSFLYTALIRHLKVVRTLALSNLYLWKKQITSEMVQLYCYKAEHGSSRTVLFVTSKKG